MVHPPHTTAPAAAPLTAAVMLSMSDIAALAQVKRPVVSTWRRRYPDFPPPAVERAGRLLFDGRQVADWLMTAGLGNADAATLRSELALHGIAALTDRFDARQLIELLGGLLCLRRLDERPLTDGATDPADPAEDRTRWAAILRRAERIDAEDQFLLRELHSAAPDGTAAPLARLAEDLVEAAYDERGAYEWLLAARQRLGIDTLTADTVAGGLRSLLAPLADLPARMERSGGSLTLADPCARSGDLLAALLAGIDDREHLTVLAADPDERLARTTRRRLLLAGIDELALDVQARPELEEHLADPDLVVAALPYRPGEDRSVLAALESVERITDLLHGKAGALVLGPADALVDPLRGADEARLRSALLRRNLVESVITLPGGVLPFRPGYRAALWTLNRDPVPAAKGKVLLADIGTESLDETVCARLAEDVLLWRAEGHRPRDGHDPRYGRAANVAELDRAFGGPLTPAAPPVATYWSRTVTERPALIAEAEARLERAFTEAARRGLHRAGRAEDEVEQALAGQDLRGIAALALFGDAGRAEDVYRELRARYGPGAVDLVSRLQTGSHPTGTPMPRPHDFISRVKALAPAGPQAEGGHAMNTATSKAATPKAATANATAAKATTAHRLLAAADRLLEHTPIATTAAGAHRWAAFALRSAVEAAVAEALRRTWTQGLRVGSPRGTLSMRAMLLCLRACTDAETARQARALWQMLCLGCHHHQYELGPTASQLRLWRAEAAQVVSRLGT